MSAANSFVSTARPSEIAMSHLADNVVVLQYLRAESELKRALLVLKTRVWTTGPRSGSSHDSSLKGSCSEATSIPTIIG